MATSTESERAAILFQAALIGLGVDSIKGSLGLWDDVPPAAQVTGSRAAERWLSTAIQYVMRRRLRARDLALAYYRYERALATGKTIALPGQEPPPYTTLPELKREFELQLNLESEKPAQADREEAPLEEAAVEQEAEPEVRLEGDPTAPERIEIEVIDNLEEELDELEKEMEAQVKDNLINLGPRLQDKKVSTSRYVENVSHLDEMRREAHEEAGRRQAAASERNVMNGARGPLYLISNRDKRVIGYVRASRTGTPCGFCAMLMSRGVVYKSEATAGDQDLWHDNCHCFAIPVYSIHRFWNEDLFAQNREYKALWNEHIKDKYSGTDALNAYRRLIRNRAKSQKSQEAAA